MFAKQSNLSLSGSGQDVSDSHEFNQFLKASNKDDENKVFKKSLPATSKLTEKYGLQTQQQQQKGFAQKGGQIYGQSAYSQQQLSQIPNMGGYQAAAQGMYANQYDENMYYDSYGQDQFEYEDEYGNKYYDDGSGQLIDEQGYAYDYPEQIIEHDPYAFDVNLDEKKETKKPAKQPTTTKKSKNDKKSKKEEVVEEDDEATKFRKRKEQLEAKRKALQEQEEAEKKRKKELEEEQKRKEQEELIRQMNLNKQQTHKGPKLPFKKSLDIADAYQSIDEDDIEDSRHNAQSEVSEEQENENDDEIDEEIKPQLYDVDQTSKYYAQRSSEIRGAGGIGKSKDNLTDSNLYDSSAEKFGESSGRYGDPALQSSKNVVNPISESGELEERSHKDYNNTSSSRLGQSSSQQYPPQQEVYDPDIMAKYMQQQMQKQPQNDQKKEDEPQKQETTKIEKIVQDKQIDQEKQQITSQQQQQYKKPEEVVQQQQQKDENNKQVQNNIISNQEQTKSPLKPVQQQQEQIQQQETKNNTEQQQQQNKSPIQNNKQFSFEDIDHQPSQQQQQQFNTYKTPNFQVKPQIQQQQGEHQQNYLHKNLQNDIRVIEEETEAQVLQLEFQQLKEKYAEAYQKNILYQTEADELVQQLEFAEKKVKQLQAEQSQIKNDNEFKMKVLKDRKDYFENIQENRAIQEIKQDFENDKENLLFEIEKLRDELEYTQRQLEKQQQKTVDFKKIDFMRTQQNAETKQLKQKIVELETIIEERNQFIKSQKRFRNTVAEKKKLKEGDEDEEQDEDDDEEIQLEFDKELEIQEILIKGYQKENEKLYEENKQLQQKIQEYTSKIFDENQKMTNVQMKLAKQQGLYILADEEPNVRTLNELSSDIVISQNDLRSAQQRIIQMQEIIEALKKEHEEKEIEMKYEIDKLRQHKMQLEMKLEGLDLNKIKEDEIYFKQMEQQYQEMLNSQQGEIKNLKYKLNWYIENSENVNKKQEEIREKEGRIQELQLNIENILSDPSSNMDKKTKQFQNMMLRDQQRIKQLERDCKQLEETLSKKNPQGLKQIQTEKEEKSTVQELKKKVAGLEEALQKKTEEYEMKVNEFRIEYDKMQMGFQQKLNELHQGQEQDNQLQVPQSQKIKFMTHDSFLNQNDDQLLYQDDDGKQGKQQENFAKIKEENLLLKDRIKALEKEVDDAKNYYVKKVKNLKGTNKPSVGGIQKDSKKQQQNNSKRPSSSYGTSNKNTKQPSDKKNPKKMENNFFKGENDVEEYQQNKEQVQKYQKQIEELEQKLKDQAHQQVTNQLITTLTGKQVNVDESVVFLQQNISSQDKQIQLLKSQQQILLELKEELFNLFKILMKYLEKPLTAPIIKINQFLSGIKEQCEFMEYNRLKTSLQNLNEFIQDLIKSGVVDAQEGGQQFLNCVENLSKILTETGVTQVNWNQIQDTEIVLELRFAQMMTQFYSKNKDYTPTHKNLNKQKNPKNQVQKNNFMLDDDSLQISDIKKVNMHHIEDNKENVDLHNQLTMLKEQIQIMQNQKQLFGGALGGTNTNTNSNSNNRNPNQMEFAMLEKKLDMLEQGYLKKEMEINFAIQNYMNSTGGVGKQNINEIHQHYNMIINVLKKQISDLQIQNQVIIQKKNAQIEECSQEIAKFMKEITMLKNIKQTYLK